VAAGNILAAVGGPIRKIRAAIIGGVGTGFPNTLERKLYQKLHEIRPRSVPFTPVRKRASALIGFSQS